MNPNDRALFVRTLRETATLLSDAQVEQCARYADLLLETNAHTNLTRITLPREMAVKHFADSLTVLQAVPDLPQKATVADVGTGAGFPGLVLKIARPDLRVTLMDSLHKRLIFLEGVVRELCLSDVSFVHARAEEAGRDVAHRDRYDLVTARAVATLPTLLEWCGPLVRTGGQFVALKSADVDDERDAARPAARLLHLHFARETIATLPDPEKENTPIVRRLIVYEKTAATPPAYPRRTAEIKASPLA